MKLSNDITIDNVLHVPNFQLNLLSISKLTQSLGCKVTFCVMQDLTTKKPIGQRRQTNGLYHLMENQSPRLCNAAHHTSNIWHKRLGHPSIHPVQLLSKTISEKFL